MADTKISALTANATAELTNEIPINDAGTTKKITVGDLQSLLGASKTVLGSAYTNSTTTGTEVTGLSQTLVAGTYRFSYSLICQSAATGTALDYGINYTGTMTTGVFRTSFGTTGTTTATGVADGTLSTATGNMVEHWSAITESTTAPNMGAHTGVASANENFLVSIDGTIIVSDGGDLELWVASEVASSQVTVGTGSNLLVIRFA
jgi:hypothetical protein